MKLSNLQTKCVKADKLKQITPRPHKYMCIVYKPDILTIFYDYIITY